MNGLVNGDNLTGKLNNRSQYNLIIIFVCTFLTRCWVCWHIQSLKSQPGSFWDLQFLARTSSSAQSAPESLHFWPAPHAVYDTSSLSHRCCYEFCFFSVFIVAVFLQLLTFFLLFQLSNLLTAWSLVVYLQKGLIINLPSSNYYIWARFRPPGMGTDTKSTSSHRHLLQVY